MIVSQHGDSPTKPTPRICFRLFYFVALVTTAVLAIQTRPFIREYDNLFAIQLPTEAEWSELLSANAYQIHDGSTDTDFLNSCYRGGWIRCLSNFDHGQFEWDYYWLKEYRPHELSGNMPDTDRVAGQLGWQRCTDRLRMAMKLEQPSTIRSRISRFSPQWVAFVFVVLVGGLILTFQAIVHRTRPRKAG